MGEVVGSESRQLHLHSVSTDKIFSNAATRGEEQLRGKRGRGWGRDEETLPREMPTRGSQGLAILLSIRSS